MITVGDVMAKPRLILAPDTPVTAVGTQMRRAGTHRAIVEADERGHFGTVDSEQIEDLCDAKKPCTSAVGEVCRRMTLAVHADAGAEEVVRLMARCNIARVAVMNGRSLVGIVNLDEARRFVTA